MEKTIEITNDVLNSAIRIVFDSISRALNIAEQDEMEVTAGQYGRFKITRLEK